MNAVNAFHSRYTPDLLRAEFWLARAADVDLPRLSADAIMAFNAGVYTTLGLPPVLALPDAISVDDVRAALARYQPPAEPHYGWDGKQSGAIYWETLMANATPALPDRVTVRFGLATRRTDVRSFPTADVVTSAPFAFALDRIQETTIDIGWPVAVVAHSRDAAWAFCLTPLYWGWVRAADIAIGQRAPVEEFVSAEPFVVTTANRGMLATPTQGGVTPQMGTRLPLIEATDVALRVRIPHRSAKGTLCIADGIGAATAGEFSVGWQPYTLHTLLDRAFALLGEPYAWGGSQLGIFGRDCSRFVQDIYGVCGVRLPRNSGQQERACAQICHFDTSMNAPTRKQMLIERVPPGAILILPGHAMLYLGHLDGEPAVIHDTRSSGFASIIVSDLMLGADGPSGALIERLSSAVIPKPPKNVNTIAV